MLSLLLGLLIGQALWSRGRQSCVAAADAAVGGPKDAAFPACRNKME